MCVARDGTAKPSGEIKRAIWDLRLSSELWGHSVGLAGSELESESDSGSDYFFCIGMWVRTSACSLSPIPSFELKNPTPVFPCG